VLHMLQAFSNVELVYLPVAVLSCFGKKVPKKPSPGGCARRRVSERNRRKAALSAEMKVAQGTGRGVKATVSPPEKPSGCNKII